jgi:hypothetical protein
MSAFLRRIRQLVNAKSRNPESLIRVLRKRSYLFVRTHNEAFIVTAIRSGN